MSCRVLNGGKCSHTLASILALWKISDLKLRHVDLPPMKAPQVLVSRWICQTYIKLLAIANAYMISLCTFICYTQAESQGNSNHDCCYDAKSLKLMAAASVEPWSFLITLSTTNSYCSSAELTTKQHSMGKFCYALFWKGCNMAFQVSKTRHNLRTKHYFSNPQIKIMTRSV